MSIREPKVSIIIPCWNAESYIAAAISSCLNQNYHNIELIVVNDGSTDASKEIIDGFGDKITAIHLPNGGAPKARNIGICKSTGQYIKLLDADDLLEEGSIRKQVDFIQDMGENEIGFGHLKEIDAQSKIVRTIKYPEKRIGKANLIYLVKRNVLISLPLYPRQALLEVSGFDERLKSRQEWNLHIRLSLHGYSFNECDVCCFRQRHHASPFRISNRSPDPMDEFDNLMAALEPLKECGDPDIRAFIALRIWNVGRWYAIKDPARAALFFKAAREYDPKGQFKYHSNIYVKLLRYSNARIAEILIRILEKLY